MTGPTVSKEYQQTSKAAIEHFYDSLRNRQYDDAFDLLSQNFRNSKYSGNLEYFVDGFQNTESIFKENCMELSSSGEFSRWLVHYDELVHIFNHPVLSKLNKVILDDFERVVDGITEFKKLMIEQLGANPDKVKKVPLINFFSTNAIEECCWSSGIKYEATTSFFEKELRSMTRVRYVNCIKSDDKWFIDSIRPVLHSSEPFV